MARKEVQDRLRLASTFERSRDRELRRLWSFHGAKPPPKLRIEDLDIREARARSLTPAAGPEEGPFPLQEGKYCIVRSLLTPELKQVLQEAERFNAEAKDSRKLADQWEKMGQQAPLVEGRRKIANSSEILRDAMVARLWTLHNLTPPAQVRFDQLRIVG